MAQYMHDGAQQSLPFSMYQPDWLAGSALYGATGDAFNQQSILDSNDNALLDNFWNNPDTAMTNNDAFPWHGMDHAPSAGNTSGQLDGFDHDSQTIQNPAMTLAGNTNSHYQTHSTTHQQQQQQQQQQQVNLQAEFAGNEQEATSEDDVKAASGLFNLWRGDSRGVATGGSWGSFGNAFPPTHVQDNLRSPIISSGRQSANSYHGQPQNTLAANSFQNVSAQQQQQLTLQQQYWWQEQQRQLQPAPHGTRHGSLQLDTASGHFYQPNSQMGMPHSAHPYDGSETRPPPVRFGSDSSFGNYGYRGPNSNVTLEHAKGANLNNVPFAAQAAANGHVHVPAFTSMQSQSQQPQPFHHYSLQSQSRAFQNTSTDSSPSNLGGLPLASPASSTHRHGHPFSQLAQHSAVDVERSEDETDYEEPRAHKRRKSQMEAPEEAAYSPSGHVKTPALKRGSNKTPKTHQVMDGSDDDYEDTKPPKSSAKRRKSSATARLNSSTSSSPVSAMASPMNGGKQPPTSTGIVSGVGSSSKKKARTSQARQNLTEDEKRRNHIQSEKTRRDLIRVQYDELDNLVPALKYGKSGLSRSDVLKEIVAYVESVVDGNEAMLGTLEGGNSASSAAAASAANGGGVGYDEDE